jgi:ferrous iron transport protein A
MQDVMAISSSAFASQAVEVRMPQMPITFLGTGNSAKVVKVRGKGDVVHHLENLGFVPGATIKVVCEQAGNLIVQVKGSQVALDRTSAQKIIASQI